MNELKVFENPEFGKIRTLTIENEPWFVGKDVAEYFSDKNYRKSLKRLDYSEKGFSRIPTSGGMQNMIIINESGLYSLFFYMQPKKSKSVSQNERINKLKRFKRWVTNEVLPAIKKTGQYNTLEDTPKTTNIGDIVNLIRVTRETMKDQGCTATDIAIAIKHICDQFHVDLPHCFIKPKETTLQDVYNMISSCKQRSSV